VSARHDATAAHRFFQRTISEIKVTPAKITTDSRSQQNCGLDALGADHRHVRRSGCTHGWTYLLDIVAVLAALGPNDSLAEFLNCNYRGLVAALALVAGCRRRRAGGLELLRRSEHPGHRPWRLA
jgi:hypothetical protein